MTQLTTIIIEKGIVTKFTLKLHPQTDVWVCLMFLLGGFISTWMRQGAMLTFAGDLVEPAQTAFAGFLAQQHDHKAAQLGSFLYSGGSVRLHGLLVRLRSQ